MPLPEPGTSRWVRATTSIVDRLRCRRVTQAPVECGRAIREATFRGRRGHALAPDVAASELFRTVTVGGYRALRDGRRLLRRLARGAPRDGDTEEDEARDDEGPEGISMAHARLTHRARPASHSARQGHATQRSRHRQRSARWHITQRTAHAAPSAIAPRAHTSRGCASCRARRRGGCTSRCARSSSSCLRARSP